MGETQRFPHVKGTISSPLAVFSADHVTAAAAVFRFICLHFFNMFALLLFTDCLFLH